MSKSLVIHTTLEPKALQTFFSDLRSHWPEADKTFYFDEMDCALKSPAATLQKAYELNFSPKSCVRIDIRKPIEWFSIESFCMFLYFYLGRQNCSIMNPEGSFHNFYSRTETLNQNLEFSSILSNFFDDLTQLKHSNWE